MFDLILFDLDGTLTDPKLGITNCVKYALESFGICESNMKVLLRFIGPPLYDSFRSIYGMTHDTAQKAVDKYRERFAEVGIFENSVLPGAENMLKTLSECGKTLALATSKPHVYAEKIVSHYSMAEYLTYKVGSELDGTRNYKDEVIKEVLVQANTFEKSRAVMVGDRKHDILGAKKCGIASIGVRCGYAEENELEQAGADYIFDDLEALTRFLMKK